MSKRSLETRNARVRRVLSARGLDERTVYWSWVPPRRRGSPWVLESTEESLGGACRVGGRGGFGPARFRHLGASGARLLVVTSSADLRGEARHDSERVDEYVLGDLLIPLKRRGGWHLVRGPDGYIGWIRSWHLEGTTAEEARRLARAWTLRVSVPFATLRGTRGDLLAAPLLYGTPLEELGRTGPEVRVRAPSGDVGRLGRDEVVRAGGVGPTAERILRAARLFRGVPYLWGGTTPKGFDCSGLVQRVYGFFGIDLPRDADQQALAGREVARARPGDLSFFGRRKITHVGIYLGRGTFLHAYGRVQENSLRPGARGYLEEVSPLFRFHRRVLP